MKTCKEMVTEFHRLNGAVIGGLNNGPEVAVLRIRLMAEELAETIAALHQDDIVEAADGLADLLYVIYGTAVSYGVDCSDAFQKPMKPPVETFDRAGVLAFERTVLRQLSRAADAVGGAPLYCGAALLDLAGMVCRTGSRYGLPMRELFKEVHRSNMTKTFAQNTPGGKYGSANPKGPGYSPPDIASILDAARRSYVDQGKAGPSAA